MSIIDVFAPASGGSSTPVLADWTMADVTSAEWTKNDPDTTMSGLTHVAGVNKCTISTDVNSKVVDGCVWYAELKTADGSSFNFGDKPVTIEFAITLPSVGWAVDGGATTGGLNRPPTASRTYCVAGVMSDPENLPTIPGETEWPRDVVGSGINTANSIVKNKRLSVYNQSNVAPRGTITNPSQDFPTISAAEYAAGRKSYNRIHWWGRIRKYDDLLVDGISTAGDPVLNDMDWVYRDDVGNSSSFTYVQVAKQRFRIHNDRLYVFISVGRQAASGAPADLDFTVHYRITQNDGGTCPSGRIGLAP